jgi:ParB-like chromosome segregation protein Spo0J
MVSAGDYLLLDGHTRLDALKRLGRTEVECILSADDEAYTFNQRVNSIPPVAQHLMILKAIESGLTEERIAASLRVNVSVIRRKRDMLDGICDEAVKLLQTRKVSALGFSLLKKMKPERQIESAKHMIASSVNSATFIRALLAATKSDMLVNQRRPQKQSSIPESVKNQFAQESESLLKDLKNLEADLGKEALTLTVFRGYVRRLIGNPRVQRYLEREHKEILEALGSGISRAD